MIGTLLGLAMLLPTDTGALQGSRLPTAAQAAVASTLSVRSITAATAQYASYPANTTSAQIIGFTIPANTAVAGNVIRVRCFGTVRNAGVSTDTFTPVLQITQNSATQVVGAVWSTTNGFGVVAWELDGVLVLNTPANIKASNPSSRVPMGNSPLIGNQTLAMSGMLRFTQTDPNSTGGNIAGGAPLTGTTADSFLITTVDPNQSLVSSAIPLRVTLELTSGPDTTFTVQGGWLELL